MAFAYLSLQELATFVSHKRTGALLDEHGNHVLARVAGDEIRHTKFYAGMMQAVLDADPDVGIIAIRDVFMNFDMPGKKSIPGFGGMALELSISGILDPIIIHSLMNQLCADPDDKTSHSSGLKGWGIKNLKPTSDDAKVAHQELIDLLDTLPESGAKIIRLREKKLARAKNTGMLPLVLEQTVSLKGKVLDYAA
jgi:hypothetical protein